MSQVEFSGCGVPLSRVEDNSKGTQKAQFGSSKHDKFHAFGGGKLRLTDGKEKKNNDFLIIGNKTMKLYNLVMMKTKELRNDLYSVLILYGNVIEESPTLC